MNPLRAYLFAAGTVGFALGAAWSIALSLIAAPDPGPPLLRLFTITTGAAIALPAAPAFAAVLLIRAFRWPPGKADIIAGAIIALLLSVLVFLGVEGLFADFKTPVTLRAGAGLFGFWLLPNMIAGAIAGLIYARLVAQRGTVGADAQAAP